MNIIEFCQQNLTSGEIDEAKDYFKNAFILKWMLLGFIVPVLILYIRFSGFENEKLKLPVKSNKKIPKRIAGLPKGLPGIPFIGLPGWAKIRAAE